MLQPGNRSRRQKFKVRKERKERWIKYMTFQKTGFSDLSCIRTSFANGSSGAASGSSVDGDVCRHGIL